MSHVILTWLRGILRFAAWTGPRGPFRGNTLWNLLTEYTLGQTQHKHSSNPQHWGSVLHPHHVSIDFLYKHWRVKAENTREKALNVKLGGKEQLVDWRTQPTWSVADLLFTFHNNYSIHCYLETGYLYRNTRCLWILTHTGNISSIHLTYLT